MRILITGPRAGTNKRAIAAAITRPIGDYAPHLIVPGEHGPRMLWDQITVVHGAARGADTLTGRIATAWGLQVEEHPVTDDDWRAPCQPACKPGHRRIGKDDREYCPAAGNYRNQRMVNLSADICLGFPSRSEWSGTRDCMTRAAKAGIRVVDCTRPIEVTL